MLQGDGQPVGAFRPGDAIGLRPVQRRLDRGGDPGLAVTPRPTMTPSAPDCSRASRAVAPSTMSPLTMTGTPTASFTARTALQSAVPL